METSVKILTGISDQEKGAYLSAIASIATADTQASPVEIEHLTHLCEAADLSAEQQESVLNAGRDATQSGLIASLNVLKGSELKYSLLTDLFAFAKSDGNYSESEQRSVQKIADYLEIDETQFGLLGELADKTNAHAAAPATTDHPDFLSAAGLGDKLKASGINAGGLLKGLVSIAAPIILSKIVGKTMSGGFGGGGISGGGSNTGGGILGGGGLGSLIGMLSGGKGMSGSGGIGGMLGKMFG